MYTRFFSKFYFFTYQISKCKKIHFAINTPLVGKRSVMKTQKIYVHVSACIDLIDSSIANVKFIVTCNNIISHCTLSLIIVTRTVTISKYFIQSFHHPITRFIHHIFWHWIINSWMKEKFSFIIRYSYIFHKFIKLWAINEIATKSKKKEKNLLKYLNSICKQKLSVTQQNYPRVTIWHVSLNTD